MEEMVGTIPPRFTVEQQLLLLDKRVLAGNKAKGIWAMDELDDNVRSRSVDLHFWSLDCELTWMEGRAVLSCSSRHEALVLLSTSLS